MKEQNTECKCPYSCDRHGDCKACQEYHRKDGSRTNCGKTGKDTTKHAPERVWMSKLKSLRAPEKASR